MEISAEQFQLAGEGKFPALIGVEVDEVAHGEVTLRLPLRPDHMAPNGYLHAGAVIGLADTACGYGCILGLPEGGIGFTTIELKTNFLRTANQGTITCEAKLVHGGRTTQIWDATVQDERERTLALFRCTQLVLR